MAIVQLNSINLLVSYYFITLTLCLLQYYCVYLIIVNSLGFLPYGLSTFWMLLGIESYFYIHLAKIDIFNLILPIQGKFF